MMPIRFPFVLGLALLWSCAAQAQPLDVSASLDLVSDYRFRGVSLTGLKPAAQADLTVAHQSGVYVNLWTSNISRTEGGARAEVDIAAGYAWESDKTSLDVSVTYYAYPGDGDLNYAELSAVVSHAVGPIRPFLELDYVPPQSSTRDDFGRKKDSIYLAAGAEIEIPDTPVIVTAQIGYERGFFDYTDTGGKVDWQVEAAVEFDHVGFGLAYVDSSRHVREGHSDLAGAGVAARLSLSF